MKILLTGASGFIGKALLPLLLAKDHEVTLVSRGHSKVKGIAEQIVCETQVWPDAVSGRYFDVCIHLAWIAKPGIYLSSPDNDLFAEMTPRLADRLFEAGLPHFFGLGTCIEYATNQSKPCRPSFTGIAPETIYGLAKERARTGIVEAAGRHGKGYTWARLFYPYGPGEDQGRIPTIFLETLSHRQTLGLRSPESVKDWIHIHDVTSAIIRIVEHSQPLKEVNLGTGIGTDILSLARTAADVVDASHDLIERSPSGTMDPYSYHVADIGQLSDIGWKPCVSIEQGLKSLANYLNFQTNEH